VTNQDPHALTLKEYNKLAAILNLFRTLHERIEMPAILVFLYVAHNTDKSQRDIARAMDMTQASVSRNLAVLSDYTNNAMHVISMREVPGDRRAKEYSLTPRGRAVLQQLKALLS
jgi:DNA-binding MarR family transcriptional regulator